MKEIGIIGHMDHGRSTATLLEVEKRIKALELFEKYKFVYIANYTSNHEVKECCLIVCDEMIDMINKLEGLADMQQRFNVKFWEWVKEEINKIE